MYSCKKFFSVRSIDYSKVEYLRKQKAHIFIPIRNLNSQMYRMSNLRNADETGYERQNKKTLREIIRLILITLLIRHDLPVIYLVTDRLTYIMYIELSNRLKLWI